MSAGTSPVPRRRRLITLDHRNVFPHSTFNWVGIDGTQVLCHMTPVGGWYRISELL
jgi:hypothetical protein